MLKKNETPLDPSGISSGEAAPFLNARRAIRQPATGNPSSVLDSPNQAVGVTGRGVVEFLSISVFGSRSIQSSTICVTVAENAGLLVIPVKASGTSQDCSNCDVKVPKKLHERWHNCPNCGCSLDRDHNAAINIKNRAVGHPVLKAQSMSYAIAGVAEKPTLTACNKCGSMSRQVGITPFRPEEYQFNEPQRTQRTQRKKIDNLTRKHAVSVKQARL